MLQFLVRFTYGPYMGGEVKIRILASLAYNSDNLMLRQELLGAIFSFIASKICRNKLCTTTERNKTNKCNRHLHF